MSVSTGTLGPCFTPALRKSRNSCRSLSAAAGAATSVNGARLRYTMVYASSRPFLVREPFGVEVLSCRFGEIECIGHQGRRLLRMGLADDKDDWNQDSLHDPAPASGAASGLRSIVHASSEADRLIKAFTSEARPSTATPSAPAVGDRSHAVVVSPLMCVTRIPTGRSESRS